MHSDSEETKKRGVLGYRNYRAEKSEFLKEDFENPRTLQIFLNEMSTGESDITEMGKTFLLEKMRSSDLAQLVADLGGVGEDGAFSAQEIEELVRRECPHDTAGFISDARRAYEEQKGEEK